LAVASVSIELSITTINFITCLQLALRRDAATCRLRLCYHRQTSFEQLLHYTAPRRMNSLSMAKTLYANAQTAIVKINRCMSVPVINRTARYHVNKSRSRLRDNISCVPTGLAHIQFEKALGMPGMLKSSEFLQLAGPIGKYLLEDCFHPKQQEAIFEYLDILGRHLATHLR